MTQYNADAIEVLTGLEPVRKRPGMYTDTVRPNHLAQEVIDNSVDEALAGHANQIDVVVHTDGAITISDNGRGIPQSELANVKQPFVQLNDASREAVVEGLGLGLALVDSLVRDHNGQMIIESNEGHGTKVTLVFPNAERATVA